MAFLAPQAIEPSPLMGAWELQSVNGESVEADRATWVFSKTYMSRTEFNLETKTFVGTRGGTYTHEGYKLLEEREFDTWDAEQVNQKFSYKINLTEGEQLQVWVAGPAGMQAEIWQRIDNGTAPLAGAWAITQRMREGEMQEIHRKGTRKTVKLLSGTRFQWIAIDPGKSAFMGTGGGSYTFEDGVYTEHIEFFSRDSSRVGMSLSFDGSVTGDDWHHSGKSSKGKPISEVWSR